MSKIRSRHSVLAFGGLFWIGLLGLSLLSVTCTRSTPERTPELPTATTGPAVTSTEQAPPATPVPATPTTGAPTTTPSVPTAEPTATAVVPTPLPTATSLPQPAGTPAAYEDRADPVNALASYFNAVNRKEYLRAYGYWDLPPNASYQDFAAGYADTASVLLVVSPPTRIGAAAGSMYAGIPTLLLATHTDGTQHNFAGCYVMRSPNPGMTGAAGPAWSLYNAVVNAAPGNSTEATLLVDACAALVPSQNLLPYEDRTTAVELLASLFNAVNLKEYGRAYGYWETPPAPSLEQFAQGYADTADVLLAVSPPTVIEGAAGSMYTSIPTLLLATHTDGSRHVFLGCYVARRPNPAMVSPPDPGWSLYSATVHSVPGQADASLLANACVQP